MEMNYNELVRKVKDRENFSFARTGDGEINAILGATNGQNLGCNCDGHHYFTRMGFRLAQIIKSKPPYYMGLQPLVQRLRKDDPQFQRIIADIDWINADIIHNASINGELGNLFDALSTRDIIFVGHAGMVASFYWFAKEYNYFEHIIISEKDCWLEYDEILKAIRKNIINDVVILYCASMPSGILIDDIYNQYGDSVTQIDMGSVLDPYAGYYTRKYHYNL